MAESSKKSKEEAAEATKEAEGHLGIPSGLNLSPGPVKGDPSNGNACERLSVSRPIGELSGATLSRRTNVSTFTESDASDVIRKSGSSSRDSNEYPPPCLPRTQDTTTITESNDESSGPRPDPPHSSSSVSVDVSAKSLSQLRNKSRYNPDRYRCQGYDDSIDYVYFDGAEGSADTRFLIDLEGPSMEGLRDVRPFFYHIGYWHWHDEKSAFPPPCFEDGDLAVEQYYVEAGRKYLLKVWDEGKDGYFLRDRDFNEYNKGEDATMPWIWAFGDQQDKDVGFDTTHENQEADYVHHVLKTNVRHCLPRADLLTPLAYQEWDLFVGSLYAGHSVVPMLHARREVPDCQYENAQTYVSCGYLVKEAMEVYPNPNNPWRAATASYNAAMEAKQRALA